MAALGREAEVEAEGRDGEEPLDLVSLLIWFEWFYFP